MACSSSGSGTTPDSYIYTCTASDDNPQTYIAGLQVMGTSQKMAFSLLDAMPAPPARGNNTWMVQINAMMSDAMVGPAVTDATIVATPFMPDHGHGTPILVGVTNNGGGQYELTPVNLWMPGYWVTTLVVTSPTAGTDTAQYKFCLPD
ncbi:MAG TPA: FixH family protein [Kofleriaceae bacterium]|nr:FixH family protein [Kofleriaceae bacterium]